MEFFIHQTGTYVPSTHKKRWCLKIKLVDNSDPHCNYEWRRFAEENSPLLQHKVVQNFLKNEDNQQLLMDAVCQPTKKNKELLDAAFKKHYFNARFTTYISTALYFYALNYDKAQRITNERYTLTIDQPIKEEGGATLNELLEDPTAQISIDELIDSNCIEDHVECQTLYEAITKLSKKQKEVIDLYYIGNFSEKDIGKMLNKSQQVVSKLHRKALRNLYNYMQKKGGI